MTMTRRRKRLALAALPGVVALALAGLTSVGASSADAAPGAVSSETTLFAEGSTWSWKYDAAGAPATWTAPAFDDSSWSTGAAPLGFGDSDIATNIDVPSGTVRPLAAYFRSSFTVDSPQTYSAITATVRSDDGVVVYINGTEIGRANIPAGEVTSGTYAEPDAARRTVTFAIPTSLLVSGKNTITAETHLNYRATRAIGIEATITATTTTLFAEGSTWSWKYDAAGAPAAWKTSAFNDSTWSKGAAPLGFGDPDIATNIDVRSGATRPLAAYFRSSFTVDSPRAYSGVTATVRSDDGVVVYINGTEIGRQNMPAGEVTPQTYAEPDSARRTVTFAIPTSLLVPGKNIITAETHLNYRTTRAIGIEAKIMAAPASNDGTYVPGWGTPVWADEFDGDSVDRSKWRTIAANDYDYYSWDQSIRYPDQISVADGTLRITAKRLTQPITKGGVPRYFESGKLDTIGTFAQQYGRWEIRAKLPLTPNASRGMWPAFWLRDSSGPGEIDIFEAYGTPRDNTSYAPQGSSEITIHQDTNHGGTSTNKIVKSVNLADGQYHTHALEWTPRGMTFYIDGVQVWYASTSDNPWFNTSFTSAGVNIRLDLSIGANWCCLYDPANPGTTSAPATMDVDYVRVWAYEG